MRSLSRADTFDEVDEEGFVFSGFEDSGGEENNSDSDNGWRHKGQKGLVFLIVFNMQDLQKIWAQIVITISIGGHIHIGQSISSPSWSCETIFFSNSGLFDTSAILLKANNDWRSGGHNATSVHIWRSRKIILSTVE